MAVSVSRWLPNNKLVMLVLLALLEFDSETVDFRNRNARLRPSDVIETRVYAFEIRCSLARRRCEALLLSALFQVV